MTPEPSSSSPVENEPRKTTWVSYVVQVLAGLIILCTIAGLFIPTIRGSGREVETKVFCNSLHTACNSYRMEYNTLPKSSENHHLSILLTGIPVGDENHRKIQFLSVQEKYRNSKGEMTDAWGTALSIRFLPDQSVQVVSAGKDRKFGTVDDITVPNPKD